MYTITTPPTSEPISLSLLKAYARYAESDTSQDESLNLSIAAARQWIERYCRIAIMPQTVTMRVRSWGAGVILLECTPYASALTITYKDSEGANQTLPTTEYDIDTYSAPPRINLYSQPSLQTNNSLPITITYVAGYGADTPSDLKKAVLILATTMDVNRTLTDDVAFGIVGHYIHAYKNEYAAI